MIRRVVLLGAEGQLGTELQRIWPEVDPDAELVALGHAEADIGDLESLRHATRGAGLVVNASAYNGVDAAEKDPGPAFAVNALGARNLGVAGREAGVPVVHVSTDYVFSGRLGRPLTEADPVDPVNAYGVSKAAGEMLLRATWDRHLIVRTSGLYGHAGSRARGGGGNFVETMLRLAGQGRPIRVVDDQVLAPTSARALARQLVVLCQAGVEGTIHAACRGRCSWFELAADAFRLAGVNADLGPISSSEFGAPAPRPACSVLDNARLRELGLERMPDWREALAEYLAERAP